MIKTLPHSKESEKALLGAMLKDNSTHDYIFDVMRDIDFYDGNNKTIFRCAADIYGNGNTLDAVTLAQKLDGNLEKIGGISYLTKLFDAMPSSSDFRGHCEIVKNKAVMRKLLTELNDITNKANDVSYEADDVLQIAESKIFEISQNKFNTKIVSLNDNIDKAIGIIEAYHHSPNGIIGVPSGFEKLDDLTAGFMKKDMIVLAARPGCGKSAMALCCALNMAKLNYNVGFFTFEMGIEQLINRIIFMTNKIDSHAARRGKLTADEWEKITASTDFISKLKIHFEEMSGKNIMQLRSSARRLKSQHKIDFLIIDYLQLIRSSNKHANGNEAMQFVSAEVKAMCIELDVPVMVLSQLTRSAAREKRKPTLYDLRDSGSIEQDADLVMFIHRPFISGEATDKDGNSTENLAEIMLEKHRNGPTGSFNLVWLPQYTTFENEQAYIPNERDLF